MGPDDARGRKARARRLRQQIEALRSSSGKPAEGARPLEPRRGESAREFIQRRMRELEKARDSKKRRRTP